MKKIETGEIITLENGKEYFVLEEHQEDGNDYVFLMSNFKPLEIRVAVQVQKGNNIILDKVKDQKTVDHLMDVFREKNTAQN